MIISKTVSIKIDGKNKSHFEKLGYLIPTYRDSSYTIRVKKGTLIKVQVIDLLPNSQVKVLCQCNSCKKQKWLAYRKVQNKEKWICVSCYHRSNEWAILQSIRSKGKPKPKGENSPFYRHDLSQEERMISKDRTKMIQGYYTWRKSVLQRDNFECQKCHLHGRFGDGIIIVHHINGFSNFKDQRTKIENGIALCKNCHKLLHKTYGKYSNIKHLLKFLKNS